MTAPSKPRRYKTARKTRSMAAALAAVLALGSCTISDFSVNIGAIHIELGAAAPAPESKPQPKAPPAKERAGWLE